MGAYINLIGKLAENKISNVKVADVLGVHVNTVANKLDGTSSFSIEEAFKIKTYLLPSYDLSYLFARCPNTGQQAS
jgi:hypothetical protein